MIGIRIYQLVQMISTSWKYTFAGCAPHKFDTVEFFFLPKMLKTDDLNFQNLGIHSATMAKKV